MFRIISIILGVMVLKSCVIAVTDPERTVSGNADQKNNGYSINPVEVGQALIGQGNLSEAENILVQFVRTMPAGWKPFVETKDTISLSFWTMEEFLYYAAYVAEKPKTGKNVQWNSQPSYSKAYYLLAFIAMAREDWDTALRLINRGLTIEPDHPHMLGEKGIILLKQGKVAEAYETFVNAYTARPWATAGQKALALRGIGTVLIEIELYDTAEEVFVKSLELEPDNNAALSELSYIKQIRRQAY